MKTALLGAGLMGYPMVGRMLAAGHEVMVYNRTKAKAESLEEAGAQITSMPREAIAFADCVILMLSDGTAIEQAVFSDSEISFNNKTLIQMGTISSAESMELCRRVEDQGGVYLECPVLGSRNEARCGKLIMMAGGRQDVFDQWQEFLKCFGPQPRWIGEVGSAAALKLALNQLIASLGSAFALSLGMVENSGVSIDQFMEILRDSFLFAPMFDRKLPNMQKREFTNPNFPLKHLLKDVNLFIKEAGTKNLSTEHLEGIRTILERGITMKLSDQDYSSLYNVLNPKS